VRGRTWPAAQAPEAPAHPARAQLALPLDPDDSFDPLPQPAPLAMDSYEFLVSRGMQRAWATVLAERTVGTDWDDEGLL
jgi:hypothetical protein